MVQARGQGREMVGRALLLGALLAGSAAAVNAAEHDLLLACDAPGPQQVLKALDDPGPSEARGVWMDAAHLHWVGLAPAEGARAKLLISHDARLVARVGEPARGFDKAVALQTAEAPPQTVERFRYLGAGWPLQVGAGALAPEDWRAQMLLVLEDAQGRVLQATGLQHAAALDALHEAAARVPDLGAMPARAGDGVRFKVWAPTARRVHVCLYPGARAPARQVLPLQRDAATGVWSAHAREARAGVYATYLVEVVVPGLGIVRNRVTDPYALTLSGDSQRAQVIDLDDPALKPAGWEASRIPGRVKRPTDMVIYELHVRDFSIGDDSVPAAHRGKYLGFTHRGSRGMRHLRALSRAGLTDVHLLPVFDLATVPERGCVTPAIADRDPAGEAQQAAVMASRQRDCFNWGYDPLHYTAPEGSYATDPDDGARRVLEFRRMVMALHASGLRVGMDVVYNHTFAAGQSPQSVLDRIVPGYYHRLSPIGAVERSTCCDNTATEHRMMEKLMLDSVLTWARHYKIASFRFDLMAHQPRAAMERLQQRLRAELGREVQLLGEGWNFGEVADGARFVQASQRSLNGTGIGTFSDRTRDAVRGGAAGDSGQALLQRPGWIHGPQTDREALKRQADLVRVGLAGTLQGVRFTSADGRERALSEIDYAGQPAGYASQPAEVVNYVENHDNQTLFDNNVLKLPRDTSREDRARVQVLAGAVTAFSQGVAYFHAGVEILRSKSLDRNSYDSGDWFNRLDWTLSDNGFGAGLPPAPDNAASWPVFRGFLADASIKPTPADIAWTRDAFLDLLRIRASSTLFRLQTAEQVQQRLRLLNTGADQQPSVVAVHLDGRGHAGANFRDVVALINADTRPQEIDAPALRGRRLVLHPVHARPDAADRRAATARFDAAAARFTVPARTAVVFVQR